MKAALKFLQILAVSLLGSIDSPTSEHRSSLLLGVNGILLKHIVRIL